MARMIYKQDNDVQEVQFEFMSKRVLDLLRVHNTDQDFKSADWQFVNSDRGCWTKGMRVLEENLD